MSHDERPGLRMGSTADHEFLNFVIAKLTVVMIDSFPAGSVDGGTMATALIEVAAHAVAATFPQEEIGGVTEHLQEYLAVAIKRWEQVPDANVLRIRKQTRVF